MVLFGEGGGVKETGQQFLLGTHNTRKCVLRLYTDKNDSKVKTTPCWTGEKKGGGGSNGKCFLEQPCKNRHIWLNRFSLAH